MIKSRGSLLFLIYILFIPIITLSRQTFCRPMLYNTMQFLFMWLLFFYLITSKSVMCFLFNHFYSAMLHAQVQGRGCGVTNRTSYMNLLYILISTPPQDLCWNIFLNFLSLCIENMFIHLTNNANNFVVVMNVFSESFDQCNIFVNI